jgi:hypothetical protein
MCCTVSFSMLVIVCKEHATNQKKDLSLIKTTPDAESLATSIMMTYTHSRLSVLHTRFKFGCCDQQCPIGYFFCCIILYTSSS